MPLTPEDRATFIALLPHLEPGEAREPVHQFVRDHWRACRDEIGANPGFDQVRAGMLRVVGDLVGPEDRGPLLAECREALERYPAEVVRGGAAALLERHPAWVGLSVLELAELLAEPRPAALERAVSLAAAGFAESTGEDQEAGNVLWAMAEQAEEVGWTLRARELWEAAADAGITDPEDDARVKLLLALRLAEDGDPRAVSALEAVAAESAEPRARVHASWVLAALHRRAGNPEAARTVLEAAMTQVDEDEDPDVLGRLQAALDELGGIESDEGPEGSIGQP